MSRSPQVPSFQRQTHQQQLHHLLRMTPHTLRQLSKALHLSEKDVIFQLEELRKSLRKASAALHCEPSICQKCDYDFPHRKHLKKPSRCPQCKSQRLSDPFYSIHER